MQVFYETGKRQVQGGGNRRQKHFLIQLCATEVEAEKCLIGAERTRCTWTAGGEERGRVCTVCNESSEDAVRLGAQRTRKHKHHMLTHSHLHPFTCTQTSNRALLKLQIIRNTLHCGRSESFLIKFKGRLFTWHTHTHTLYLFACCKHTSPLHKPAGSCPLLDYFYCPTTSSPHSDFVGWPAPPQNMNSPVMERSSCNEQEALDFCSCSASVTHARRMVSF